MKREPLVTRATLVAIATAILSLLVAFGWHIDGDTKKAILTIVGALAPIVAALLARPKVTPVDDPRP